MELLLDKEAQRALGALLDAYLGEHRSRGLELTNKIIGSTSDLETYKTTLNDEQNKKLTELRSEIDELKSVV